MRARQASTARSIGLRRGGVLLALAVSFAVALIGSAQAASSKPFTAFVYVTKATPGSFTLKLANDPKAQQSLGSANFTAPANLTVPANSQTFTTTDGHTWTVTSDGSRVVTFRAATNGDALGKGQSVSASLAVTLPQQALCTSALWAVRAKQSNDFSGSPGNDFTFDPAHSDMTPLGSFTFARIGTTITTVDPPFFTPQVVVDQPFSVAVNAYDTCGSSLDADYSGGKLSATPLNPTRLVGADGLGSLSFSGGHASAAVTPHVVETADTLTVTDDLTGVSAASTASSTQPPNEPFDVVEKLCTYLDPTCDWSNKGKSILAHADTPP